MRRAVFQAIGWNRGAGAPRERTGRCGERCCRDGQKTTLSMVAPGQACTICRLRGGGPVRQRLLDLGFQPGRAVKVVRSAPLADPIELQLDDCFIALRRHEAAHIEVTDA